MKRRSEERLQDILEAIAKIEEYTPQDRQDFDEDELLQTFFVHHLQIIGEAVYKLPKELLDQYPQVPWPNILGMRHILVHGYFHVDLDLVWSVVETNLDELKEQVETILKELENSE